ncbi:DUF2270 domain-containing protein [Natrialbaceae archaeon GCM10025810]|uniref:DUF2270 domain-containing protein n=1 Tax=Halovalidus salilacus TaxID=3075124 RepID=UPI00360F4B00
MTTDEDRSSPLEREDHEVGADIANDADGFLSLLPHYYRGEVSQASGAQDRIDQTTNWAITVMVALLSIVFSSRNMPAYLLLIGLAALAIFLSYEVRRYRFYDLHRARVRFLQENVFANAMSPRGAEHPRWRDELSDDLRYPTFKVTAREALARRITRIYGLLFGVVGVAWAGKVTLFTPETQWTEAAELPGVPGQVVAGLLAVFYLCLFALSAWPTNRDAKGEIYGEKSGEWKPE